MSCSTSSRNSLAVPLDAERVGERRARRGRRRGARSGQRAGPRPSRAAGPRRSPRGTSPRPLRSTASSMYCSSSSAPAPRNVHIVRCASGVTMTRHRPVGAPSAASGESKCTPRLRRSCANTLPNVSSATRPMYAASPSERREHRPRCSRPNRPRSRWPDPSPRRSRRSGRASTIVIAPRSTPVRTTNVVVLVGQHVDQRVADGGNVEPAHDVPPERHARPAGMFVDGPQPPAVGRHAAVERRALGERAPDRLDDRAELGSSSSWPWLAPAAREMFSSISVPPRSFAPACRIWRAPADAALHPRHLHVGDRVAVRDAPDRVHQQHLAERRAAAGLALDEDRRRHVHERQRHELGEAAGLLLELTRAHADGGRRAPAARRCRA